MRRCARSVQFETMKATAGSQSYRISHKFPHVQRSYRCFVSRRYCVASPCLTSVQASAAEAESMRMPHIPLKQFLTRRRLLELAITSSFVSGALAKASAAVSYTCMLIQHHLCKPCIGSTTLQDPGQLKEQTMYFLRSRLKCTSLIPDTKYRSLLHGPQNRKPGPKCFSAIQTTDPRR